MKFKLLLVALTFSFSAGTMADATTDAINAAIKAQKDAKAVGFEWTNMGKDIKKAEKLAKEGKDKKAISVANVVIMHGKAALKQAALAKKAGPRF